MSNLRKLFEQNKTKMKQEHDKVVNQGGRASGFSGKSIINFKELPEGRKLWTVKQKETNYFFDIIPFVCGSQHPTAAKGETPYMIFIQVHNQVGANKDSFICPKTYEKPCPICEFISKNKGMPKDEWVALSSKPRGLYLIWDRENEITEGKGIQVFNSSYLLLGKNLDTLAKTPRGGGSVAYYDIDHGKTIGMKVEGTGVRTNYLGIGFHDRVSPIPEEILDQTFELDMFLNIATYDEINASFTGISRNHLPKLDHEMPLDVANFNPCPAGMKYGIETNKSDDCEQCDVFSACFQENIERRSKK